MECVLIVLHTCEGTSNQSPHIQICLDYAQHPQFSIRPGGFVVDVQTTSCEVPWNHRWISLAALAHTGRSTQENWVWKSTVISFKWKKPWWEQQNILVLIPQLMEFCILRRHNFAYRASSGPHPVPSTQVGVLPNSSHPRVLLYNPKWISKMMPRRDWWWSHKTRTH